MEGGFSAFLSGAHFSEPSPKGTRSLAELCFSYSIPTGPLSASGREMIFAEVIDGTLVEMICTILGTCLSLALLVFPPR